ncbi:MAG: tRNA (cytidine(34)-2'-O)-methyltransferase [Lysobacterales bacterium]|jgi:tRNA (cytidine/uridine-2'-O-)-methyltransferase|nr:MAG: tRNA (cytidine(34)-2'-O)-methyltransferase [Xanthomonadales bacterium]RPI17310.1 MAG: tRNA (cytidine(34)-2'-O)-methyltransferase [Xanthomonadales bacterium]
MPLDVVLFQPEIPPNTGNVIRLCANTGARLHLVRPLGFQLDARAVRRAGLDYHELAEVEVHATLADCFLRLGGPLWYAFTTCGDVRHDEPRYVAGDVLLFGPETRGLPDDVLDACPPERRVRIPMRHGARSLNLSNAVAVAVYEAWRQLGYARLAPAASPSRSRP